MVRLQDKWVVANADGSLFASTRAEGADIKMVDDWDTGAVAFHISESYAEMIIEHYFAAAAGVVARRAADFPDRVLKMFAARLTEAAGELGQVITIQLNSKQPLAMRNYEYVVDIRPAQGG